MRRSSRPRRCPQHPQAGGARPGRPAAPPRQAAPLPRPHRSTEGHGPVDRDELREALQNELDLALRQADHPGFRQHIERVHGRSPQTAVDPGLISGSPLAARLAAYDSSGIVEVVPPSSRTAAMTKVAISEMHSIGLGGQNNPMLHDHVERAGRTPLPARRTTPASAAA